MNHKHVVRIKLDIYVFFAFFSLFVAWSLNVNKTSNCLFTTETEFDIYLLNLGKMLIIRSLYWHMLSDIIIRRIQEVLLLYT
jgi:hypothetical protein